jgi:hypothetical protein
MIESYAGVPGVAVNVETEEELLEAVDLLHTQVMDNISEDSPLLKVLEKCMDEIREIIDR